MNNELEQKAFEKAKDIYYNQIFDYIDPKYKKTFEINYKIVELIKQELLKFNHE